MEYKDTPWNDIVIDTRDYTVYKDAYPVTEGHILFVPKEQDWSNLEKCYNCLLYTSPSPRDATLSRMPSSA